MKINATFNRKETEIYKETCEIVKIVEVSELEFLHFSKNLLKNYDFIADYNDLITHTPGCTRCILILGEDCDDGILVNSEGYDYACNTAYVPNARQLVQLDQRYYCIIELEKKLLKAVDEIISSVKEHDGDDIFYRVLTENITASHGLENHHMDLLVNMLSDSELAYVFESFEITDGEIFMYYRGANHAKEPRKAITESKLEIMKARHTLWLHGIDGGERADFSNMEIENACFAYAKLDKAIFKGATFYCVNMDGGSFMNCDFTNANFTMIFADVAVFDGSDFTDVKFKNCELINASMGGCNFTNADMTDAELNMQSFCLSNFTGTKLSNKMARYAKMHSPNNPSNDLDEQSYSEITMG